MSLNKKSILEELNSVVSERNKLDVVATRGNHIIKSAINLIDLIEENFDTKNATCFKHVSLWCYPEVSAK